VSEYLCRDVQFGILEQPSIPFSSGKVMNPIPQTPEDLAFGREDLRAECQEGIYEEETTGEAERTRSTGAMISSSFVVWENGPVLCGAKDETSVEIMGRMFCCNFLRKSRL
jgi:hypothetical protein